MSWHVCVMDTMATLLGSAAISSQFDAVDTDVGSSPCPSSDE